MNTPAGRGPESEGGDPLAPATPAHFERLQQRAVLGPLATALGAAALLALGLGTMLRTAGWVLGVDEVLRRTQALEHRELASIVALRQWTVSGDPRELARFRELSGGLPAAVDELRTAVQGEPRQLQQLDVVERQLRRWLDAARRIAALPRGTPRDDALEATHVRERGALQDELETLTAVEFQLRHDRWSEARRLGGALLGGTFLLLCGVGAYVLRRTRADLGESSRLFGAALHGALEGRRALEERVRERTDALLEHERRLAVVALTQLEVLGGELSPEGTEQLILANSLMLTGASGASLERPDGQGLRIASAIGTIAPAAGRRLTLDGTASGLALRTQAPVSVEDARTDPRTERCPYLDLGTRALVAVGIHGETGPLGVLKVVATRPGALDGNAVNLLQLLAGLLAVSGRRPPPRSLQAVGG